VSRNGIAVVALLPNAGLKTAVATHLKLARIATTIVACCVSIVAPFAASDNAVAADAFATTQGTTTVAAAGVTVVALFVYLNPGVAANRLQSATAAATVATIVVAIVALLDTFLSAIAAASFQ